MVILLSGASHAGKTLLAKMLLERLHFPTLSQDHLKMGLIRAGKTDLTPEDDEALCGYLWPITAEIIKTAIENRQDLIVEGCYVPGNWADSFTMEYRKEIRAAFLVMSEKYVRTRFGRIQRFANAAEYRGNERLDREEVIRDNAFYKSEGEKYGTPILEITEEFLPEKLAEQMIRIIEK